MREIEEALVGSKNRKATGADGINTELYKYGSTNMTKRMQLFMNTCWKNKK